MEQEGSIQAVLRLMGTLILHSASVLLHSKFGLRCLFFNLITCLCQQSLLLCCLLRGREHSFFL